MNIKKINWSGGPEQAEPEWVGLEQEGEGKGKNNLYRIYPLPCLGFFPCYFIMLKLAGWGSIVDISCTLTMTFQQPLHMCAATNAPIAISNLD